MTLHSKKSIRLFTSTRAVMVCLLMASVIFLSGCDDDDDNDAPAMEQSIVQVAQGNSNLSTLVSALTKYPDLVSTLNGNGAFTVFAPTNAAFDNLLDVIGQSSVDDIPENVLKNVLEYHVITTASLQASELTPGNEQQTMRK